MASCRGNAKTLMVHDKVTMCPKRRMIALLATKDREVAKEELTTESCSQDLKAHDLRNSRNYCGLTI